MTVLLGVADSSFGDLRRAISLAMTCLFRILMFDATLGFVASLSLYIVAKTYSGNDWVFVLTPGLMPGLTVGAIVGFALGLIVNGRGVDFDAPVTVLTSSARKLATVLAVGVVHSRAAAVGALRNEVWKNARKRRGKHWREVLEGYRNLLLTNFVLAQELPSHVVSFYSDRGLAQPKDLAELLTSWFDDSVAKENGWRADALDRLLGILIREGRLEPVEATSAS